MYNDITGIILAGGKSSRMGENKSLLKLEGITVIERVVNLMQKIFKDVILITNTPDEYDFLSIPMYKDIYEYKGPLAGIHSGLTHTKTDSNFIISCDIPLMTEELIKYILEFKTEKPITICKADGFIQQLAGKYSKSVLENTEELLLEGIKETRDSNQKKRKCAVLSLIDSLNAEIIEIQNVDFYKEGTFNNMNRPEDYKKILEILS